MIISGWTGRYRHQPSVDMLIFKLGQYGEIVNWQAIRKPYWQAGHEVAETPDGGFVVAGIAQGRRRLDGWIVKFDSELRTEWTRRDGTQFGWDEWHGVAVTDNGLIFSGGTVRSGRMRTFAMTTTFDGQVLWQRYYLKFSYSWSIAEDPDGGFVLTGVMGEGVNAFLLKLTPDGDQQWGIELGGEHVDTANYVIATSDGGLLLAGYYGQEAGPQRVLDAMHLIILG